ncbi:DUF4123 domain-containing protein [Jannaschia sp. Os4]|uniref:DUF4123 domain-containing protein n=1 Tax=Jannaschia sp. Os4 TaxID=2807617 RepID=UPI00193A9968|nr:DUF4123 domain-containing protein [Jannaschia sp. Os4]MBM2578104.1 DUF4123 domain-containing protein [Jannaschia sp. Os4]
MSHAPLPPLRLERLDDHPGLPSGPRADPSGDALWRAVFREDGLATYALLDAGRVPGLVETLEGAGLPHRCLYRGDARRDLGEAAPWLVALAPGADLARRLLTGGPAPFHLWDRAPGILLRAEGGLDAVVAHLRRLTKLRDGEAWTFFRFWEPAVLEAYLAGLDDRPEAGWRWFGGREGARIAELLLPRPERDALTRVTAAACPARPVGPLVLEERDRARIAAARTELRLDRMERLLRDTFPDLPPPEPLPRLVRRTVSRGQQFGLLQIDALFTLCAWELAYGPGFEGRDPEGRIAAILRRDVDETHKIALLRARMAELAEGRRA